MPKADYKILPSLTRTSLETKLKSVFKNNGSDMNTYGITGDYCYRWVKQVLIDIGIVETPYRTVPGAWDFFAGLSSNKMKYFDVSFSPGGFTKYDYHLVIEEKLAFVFGYFPKSRFKDTSVASIKRNAPDKVETMKLIKRKGVSQDIQPITHIGLYHDGLFYDFASNSVRVDVASSFVPIAYYCFYNDLLTKLPQ